MCRLILLFAALMLVACSPVSITISLGATPTPTLTSTPEVIPTWTSDATAEAERTAIAQTRAAEAAQSRAVATSAATAQANATTQARAAATNMTATAQAKATATAQANASATAQAAAATKTALLAFADALIAKAGRPEREKEGEISETKWFWVNGNWKNFVLDVQLFNPADPAVHPWDYGVEFRRPSKDKYLTLLLRSDKTWVLFHPERTTADSTILTRVSSGTVAPMDNSTTGSNKIRLVAYENAAFLYINGVFVSTMDLSVNLSAGELYLVTGFLTVDYFAGSIVRFKDLSVAGLP